MNWDQVVIAIVGGDRREQEIARCAVAAGAQVRAYGFPWPDQGIEGVRHAANAREALEGADIALFPIPGIAPDGALFAPQCAERIVPDSAMLGGMRRPGHIILGWADPKLKAHCEAIGITLHEYEWDEDLMLLRGPAIVEGMLKVLIENTDITIHKAKVCLVGQGTIGSLVTHTLLALGARVHVAARNAVQRAAAHAAGAESHELTALADVLPGTDIVIASVPARVLGRELLQKLPPHALLVDLAAPPGGIDRDAAQELGLKFVWARGLGARAPITVGRSQWSGVRRRIDDILKGIQ
ncbi:dipicolinate synthase subunit DpsA [Variovorax guangxiensis]|uniref:dipicolinate synthase subunit DpsA n=1 Tax=Variovorax guangxiensis TaxID=1775474 RepID=UPI00285D9F91|nr:dipicolinate synthase subunit DpsA [Variovorax guangxiensis]MDR6861367.1 dipicolinate synthase subunit A [Variovorax guangxiensis]